MSLVIHPREYLDTAQVQRPFRELGDPVASWNVDITGLGPHSIVYSFGIGENISFDRLLTA